MPRLEGCGSLALRDAALCAAPQGEAERDLYQQFNQKRTVPLERLRHQVGAGLQRVGLRGLDAEAKRPTDWNVSFRSLKASLIFAQKC